VERIGLIALTAAALLMGCDHNEYEIVVTPKGNRMVRKITVARLDRAADKEGNVPQTKYAAFPRKELEAIAAIYKAPVPAHKQDFYVFEATFAGATPHDVGGAGSYTQIATPMGSAHYYTERFRGDDNQAENLQASFRAIDDLLDVLGGWLRSELGKEKDFDKIEILLDRDLRKDLKNLSLALWTGVNVPRMVDPGDKEAKERIQQAVAARILQYLTERNYFQVSDIPAIFRPLVETVGVKQEEPPPPEGPGAPAPAPAPKDAQAEAKAKAQAEAKARDSLQKFLHQVLGAKAGVTDKRLIEKMAALILEPEAAGQSLVNYYAKTKHFTKAKAEWRKQAKRRPETQPQEEPSAENLLSAMVMSAAPAQILSFGTDDRVTLKLNVPVKPVASNGTWDAKIRQVTWTGEVKERNDLEPADDDQKDHTLPMFCYAVWVRAGETFQKAHFGKVVLRGKDLGQYCVWRKGLAKAEGEKWDAFVASLKPGAGLSDRIQAFRFQPLKAGQDPKTADDYAERATDLLLKALQADKDAKGT